MKFIANGQTILALPGLESAISAKDGFFDVPDRLAHLARSHGLKPAVLTAEELGRAPIITPKVAAPDAAKVDEGF
jgi:hypothetical protein